MAIEQWSRNLIKEHYVALLELHRQDKPFAADWDSSPLARGCAENGIVNNPVEMIDENR